ncbi:16495_t:CDS:1, partial [Racocetra persica]
IEGPSLSSHSVQTSTTVITAQATISSLIKVKANTLNNTSNRY